MTKIKNTLIIILFFPFLFSCQKKSRPDYLERALSLAGENRSELEKVLEHYGKNPADSLKLKAARFLIENMDAYFFYASPGLDTYYNTLDSIFSLNERYEEMTEEQKRLLDRLRETAPGNFRTVPDLQYVTAGFLTDNIDRAFEAWQQPFAKELDFDGFCEFLLPYKFGTERPGLWRSACKSSIYPYVKFMLDHSCRLDSGLIQQASQVTLNGDSHYAFPANSFDAAPDFTLSCRVNLSGYKPMSRVFDFGQDSSYYICFIPFSNEKKAVLEIRTGTNWKFLYAGSLPLNEQSHIAVSYSNHCVLFYVNGVLVDRVSVSLDSKKLVSNYLGKSHWDFDPNLLGQVEDFRIYNRELNYTEVRRLAGKENELPGRRHELQEILWRIRDLYSVSITYENLFPGSYRPVDLLNLKKGNCYDYTVLGIYISRALGIPAGFDFVPQWANRSMGHTWNVIYTGGDRMEDYSFSASWDTLGNHVKSRKERIAKIFRQTYARQPDAIALNHRLDECLPELFRNARIKDVTDLYLDCVDVPVTLTQPPLNRQQYAYLCNFNNQEWIPVHWGKINGEKAVFTKVGKAVACLPVYYGCEEIQPAGSPFILTGEGEIRNLIPDHSLPQRLVLTRKFHPGNIAGRGELLLGGRFQVANKADFSDSLTVFTVNETPEIRYNSVPVSLNKPYRYFRFLAAEGSKGDIAEIEIYPEKTGMKLSGKVIGNRNCPKGWEPESAFDSDPLTAYQSEWNARGCVGLDFGKPVNISHFRFLPRNDDNFIKEGEEYELFYWDNYQWNSLGTQTGTSKQYLEYTDAPSNALFWLRNLTKGREERIFTYENGKQVWW